MNKIIAPLTKFLTSRESGYELDRAKGVLHAWIEGDNAKWRYIACQDDAGRFVMMSLLPLKAPAARRGACAELFTRINITLGLGHFDLDFSDGELAFRTAVPVGVRSRLRVSVIEHVIIGHQMIIDKFLPPISAVLFAGLTPEESLSTQRERGKESASNPRFSLN